MLRLRAAGFCAVLILLISCISGCVQGNNRVEEDRDPHFQKGRALASQQDFKGAAAEYEKALDTNPRSAAAHFELGWLDDTKFNDYAAAIYHYNRLLQLRPDYKRAPLVQDRIRGCREELARGEFPLPNGRNWQKEVDRLNAENLSLKQQLNALKKQISYTPVVAQSPVDPARYAAPPVAVTAHPRAHVVKAHETIVSIAAEYGMKPSAILAANPQTNPRRLRVGQSLSLP